MNNYKTLRFVNAERFEEIRQGGQNPLHELDVTEILYDGKPALNVVTYYTPERIVLGRVTFVLDATAEIKAVRLVSLQEIVNLLEGKCDDNSEVIETVYNGKPAAHFKIYSTNKDRVIHEELFALAQ